MYRPTVAEVHLEHLEHNYRLISSAVKEQSFFCAMVKANGYGHGDTQVSKALSQLGCETFGVALVEEGIALRQSGIRENILVFGVYTQAALDACYEFKLIPVLSQLKDLNNWAQIAQKTSHKLKFHLEINSGMNRLGVALRDIGPILQFIDDHNELVLDGVFTHLSHGEDYGESSGHTEKQIASVHQAINLLKHHSPQAHIYASSSYLGFVRDLQKHQSTGLQPQMIEGARVGLALYGVQPAMNQPSQLALKPVLRLRTAVMAINKLSAGETVSYSGTWKAKNNSLIGVIPVGFADGYSRYLSNCGEVLVHGQRAPVVGNVCMDYTMIDLTEIAQTSPINIGDEVVLMGWQGQQIISAEELAKTTNSIAYTLLTGISNRVPREYVS